MLQSVLIGLPLVAEAVVATVRKLTRDLERLRAPHRPDLYWQSLLDRSRECEQPVVLEELAVERNGAVVEQSPDDLDALLDLRQRLGPRPVDVVLGQQAEIA